MTDRYVLVTGGTRRIGFAIRYDTEGDATQRWDGVVLEAKDCFVNQAVLTGETFPVQKKPGQVAGTFRRFDLDLSDHVSASGPNTLAIKVWAQELTDLGWNWVDWNPFPGDKDMGLWGEVALHATGPVRLRWPQVESRLDLANDRADLIVSAQLHNAGPDAVVVTLSAQVAGQPLSQPFALAAGEVREVALPPLRVAHPRLWWPAQMGEPALYDLALNVSVAERVSDQAALRFGVRSVTSELTAEGNRLFRVNGKRVLIRGAGYAPDLFLRRAPVRMEDEIRYVRAMNLNALRLEGKLGDERLYELCDQYGILILAGWCCCDQWEMQEGWRGDNHAVAVESLRDQARLLRSHPSVLVWMHGSDNTPPPDLERAYADTLVSVGWPNPSLASANSTVTPVLGTAGVKMPGPYMWVPPVYWATDQHRGGAFGFNTETSTGAAIPPVASLRRFLAPQHLWPVDEHWTYHAGSATFTDLGVSLRALDARHGAATDVEDLARKSQLMAYEGVRAMFEAYGRNKYQSTGVIQWMLNNAWPGLIWHLYDYYLRPAGGYFGAQRACEPLHVQYGYHDRAVAVVSGPAQRGLQVVGGIEAVLFVCTPIDAKSVKPGQEILQRAVERRLERHAAPPHVARRERRSVRVALGRAGGVPGGHQGHVGEEHCARDLVGVHRLDLVVAPGVVAEEHRAAARGHLRRGSYAAPVGARRQPLDPPGLPARRPRPRPPRARAVRRRCRGADQPRPGRPPAALPARASGPLTP